MYIKRHMEEVVEECLEQFPVLLITGPRQVGKTTMLLNKCSDYTYVTFDDPILLREAVDESNLFLKNNPFPLFIDEVQYAPEIFRYLKMQVDKHRIKGAYVLTGLQAFELMKNVSETLSGRMAIIELQGLSLREIFEVPFKVPFIPTEEYLDSRGKYLKEYKDIWNIIQKGSMPEFYNSKINWERYYSSYLKTYIEKDVRQIVNISNELKFTKFLTSLAARCGELLNYTSIADEIEVSVETVKNWVSILKTSGLIFLLEPYANNILKRVVKTPKVYFYDIGLVCFLTRWTTPEVLRNGAKAGNIFENFVVSEIFKTHLNAGSTIKHMYFYRDKEKKEIDLIIEDNGTLYPVEIKMSGNPIASMARNFDVLDKIPNMKRGQGIIICQYERKTHLADNLVAIPVEYI